VAARLAELDPGRALVNLAAPGALAAVAALRAAACARRLWAYVGAPGAPAVLTLGMVEVAARPLDAEALLGLLAVYATRGTRVLAVGAEADAFISLRQAAGRQGMSLSIAWDDKQAADLVPMVRPEIVVVDLALPPARRPRRGREPRGARADAERDPRPARRRRRRRGAARRRRLVSPREPRPARAPRADRACSAENRPTAPVRASDASRLTRAVHRS
jgi:hypothetical protein